MVQPIHTEFPHLEFFVYWQPQFKQGLVATVMEGSEATASVIDPLGADIKPGPNLYTQLIKNMAKTLKDCL